MNIYWLIALMPKWLIIAFIIVGVIGILAAMFVNKIPFIKQYNLPITIAAVLLLVSGVYLQGALAYKESTDKAVADLKVRLAQAEAKSAKVNIKIVEKIVKDTEVIRVKGKTITEYIDREIVQYDDRCEIPKEVINAHNAAATMDLSKLDGESK
jgi:DMSO reductase anchor subunit